MEVSKTKEGEGEATAVSSDVVNLNTSAQPVFNFLSPNKCRLIGRSFSNFSVKEEYFKGCKWSPDGTCLLTSSNDAVMRLFDLPLELYNNLCLSFEYQSPALKPSVTSKVGGLVYDYGWYPAMTSTDPDTCCFFTTSFCEPVHLWDAYSGTIRCSYRGYNDQDELHAALSVTFNHCGDLLLCGYKNHIKIFHTDVPGRNFSKISTKDVCEQRGIISCIAVNPSMPNLFASGTYTKSVGLYSLDGHGICLLSGQGGGLTQLLFTQDGTRLLAAGRKDSEILCWDLRNLGQVLWVAQRPHTTNQRIYMDISPDNNHLLSGSTDGYVYAWDLQRIVEPSLAANSVLSPLTKWQAHNDCVNGLSVHRHIPIIATASGQRHLMETNKDTDDETEPNTQETKEQLENSVKIWWAGKNKRLISYAKRQRQKRRESLSALRRQVADC